MGPVAQHQPQIARGEAGMLAHHGFGAAAFAVLDGIDHDAVMILPD